MHVEMHHFVQMLLLDVQNLHRMLYHSLQITHLELFSLLFFYLLLDLLVQKMKLI